MRPCLSAAPGRAKFMTRNQMASEETSKGCLVQVGNGIEVDAGGSRFEPYRWRPCGVTLDVVPEQSWHKSC